MTYRKTWFSWINFFLSAGLTSVLLFSFFTLLFSVVVKVDFVSQYSYLFASFSVLLLYGLFFLLNFIKGHFVIKREKLIKVSSFVISSLFFVGITLFYSYKVYEKIVGLLLNDTTFGSNANLSAIIDSMIYGGQINHCTTLNYLYCSCIAFIYKIFGINLAYACIFEIFLFSVASFLLFFSINNLFGKTPAIFCYGFSVVLYEFISSSLFKEMDSFNLLFFLASLIIYIFSGILTLRSKGKMKSNANLLLFIIFGALFGLLVFLDFSQLFIFIGAVYLLSTTVTSSDEKAINRRFTPTFLFTLMGIIVSIGCFALDSFLSGVRLIDSVYFLGSGFYLINVVNVLLPTDYLNECIVILAFTLFSVLAFLSEKSKDKYGSVLFSFLLFVVLSAFKIININVSFISCIFYGVLVGCGIKEILFCGYKTITKSDAELFVISDDINEDSNIQDSVITEEKVVEKSNESATFDKKAFIDNPLPLPKKHVKKTYDYTIEPEECLMCYDIEIKDNDDFDI